MNQNTWMVSLINRKEQLNTLYQNKRGVISPIIKGLLSLAVFYFMRQMFPYSSLLTPLWTIGILALLQAFLPISFLFYLVSGYIMVNLWSVSFDICLAYFAFVFVVWICYFRIDHKYSYLAVVVPVCCYLKIGIMVPAVLAIAVGFQALIPVAVGMIIYYLSLAITQAVAATAAEEAGNVGVGLIHVVNSMIKNQTMLMIIVAAIVTIMITSFLRKIFHEQAWLIASCVGNIVMAGLLIGGSLYFKLDMPLWLVLLEAVLAALLCFIVEAFRGVGDVSRIEKTVFEDDEYIYYVKAVPKIKVAQSERNVKIINDSVSDDSEEEEDEDQVEILDEEAPEDFAEEYTEDSTEDFPEEDKDETEIVEEIIILDDMETGEE